MAMTARMLSFAASPMVSALRRYLPVTQQVPKSREVASSTMLSPMIPAWTRLWGVSCAMTAAILRQPVMRRVAGSAPVKKSSATGQKTMRTPGS